MQTNCVVVGLASACSLIFAVGVAPAQAQGVELGVRLGYGIPLGTAVPGSGLNRNIAGAIPLGVDLGYRLNPQWMVGAYGQYGFGLVTPDDKRLCDTYHVDCSVHDLRFGAQVQYHVITLAQVDPWIGAGLGYEWLTADGVSGGRSSSATLNGWELANLQGGVNWVVSDGFALGPFMSFTFARYTNIASDCSGAACGSEVNGSIDDPSLHHWVVIGVRGTFLCGTRGRGAPCPIR